MKLGEMTWPDAKALDKTTIVPVYPIVSFEQHDDQEAQFRGIDEMRKQGTYGDPSYGTAEKGERMLDAAADSLVEVVRDIQRGRF